MKEIFAQRLRNAAKKLTGNDQTFSLDDLAHELGIKDSKSRMHMRNALRNLKVAGEVERIRRSIYCWRQNDVPIGEGNTSKSLAERIRETAQALSRDRENFTLKDLAEKSEIKTLLERKRINTTLRDLIRAEKIIRINRGVYKWEERISSKPQVQEVMWRILRARRIVSIEDLQELAGASFEYAREWLGMLIRCKILKKISDGRYCMIEDTMEMPRNEWKIEKLRQLRHRQKQTFCALDVTIFDNSMP